MVMKELIMKIIKTKNGFTLSEVMVTIGILGVLAALLVPAIVNNAPDNNKVMYKKAYHLLEQSVGNLINDDVNYPEDVTGNCKIGTTTVNCGFNNTTATVNGANNKFCYLLADSMNTVGAVNCAGPGTFETTDGIKWTVGSPTFATIDQNVYENITIDVNAAKAGCSKDSSINTCSASASPDTFVIGVRYDGKIRIGSSAGADPYAESILSNPTNNKKN